MKMDLIILTTAICRPEVHIKTFPPLIEAIQRSNKINHVYHLINIDNVMGIRKINPIETREHFESLFRNSSKIERMYSIGDQPCFLKAVKVLATGVNNLLATNYSSNFEKKVGILLFEDDWSAKNPIDFDNILEHFNENIYILLSDKKLASHLAYQFHPSLWSRNLFKEIYINSILNNQIILDPERVVKFGAKKLRSLGLKHDFYQFRIFKDVGRKWIKQNKLLKWNKKHKKSIKKITY